MKNSFKNARQLIQLTRPMREVVDKLSTFPYFFCFDYQDEWRIITWAKEDHKRPFTSDLPRVKKEIQEKDISSQMPFQSGWIGAIQYQSISKQVQKYYCSCSLGYHYPSNTWHFYGSTEEEEELFTLLLAPSVPAGKTASISAQSSMSKEEYMAKVEQLKKRFPKEMYQINLSYRIGPFELAISSSMG